MEELFIVFIPKLLFFEGAKSFIALLANKRLLK